MNQKKNKNIGELGRQSRVNKGKKRERMKVWRVRDFKWKGIIERRERDNGKCVSGSKGASCRTVIPLKLLVSIVLSFVLCVSICITCIVGSVSLLLLLYLSLSLCLGV